MKTILQALKDEIAYPVGEGLLENKLICRGLNGNEEYNRDVALSHEFKGAVADSLYSLIESPSFSEADTSISLSDKTLILQKVNALYNSIGEEEVRLGSQPAVYIC